MNKKIKKLNLPQPADRHELMSHLKEGGVVCTQDDQGALKFYRVPTGGVLDGVAIFLEAKKIADVICFANASGWLLIYLVQFETMPVKDASSHQENT